MNLLFYISFPARIQSTVTERALKHRLIPVQNEQKRTNLSFLSCAPKGYQMRRLLQITVHAGSVGQARSITVRSCSHVPNKPARKPRPHERNGLGQKMWPWKQEECDLVKQCLAARKLSASRVPVLASASSNWHRFEGRSGLELEAWNSWFNVAARCTGARRLRVFVGRVAREPPATVWLGRARVKERRNARQGRGSARSEQISARRVDLSRSYLLRPHMKNPARSAYIYSNKMCKR